MLLLDISAYIAVAGLTFIVSRAILKYIVVQERSRMKTPTKPSFRMIDLCRVFSQYGSLVTLYPSKEGRSDIRLGFVP